jgi:hypothetical protein
MKVAMLMLVLFGLSACSPQSDPTPPVYRPVEPPGEPPPQDGRFSLWGMVGESSGACVEKASVEIVRGQPAQLVVQQVPCDYWGYGNGFILKDVIAGQEITIRAMATGYVTREETFVPSLTGHVHWITLSPAPPEGARE